MPDSSHRFRPAVDRVFVGVPIDRRVFLAGAAASVLATGLPVSGAAESSGVADVILPTGAPWPNGIARASDGTLYVGLITQGGIWRKRPGRDWDLFVRGTESLYAATSLRLDEARGVLWGACPDYLPGAQARPQTVFAIDVTAGRLTQQLTLPDRGQANDIAIAPDGAIYVTDSGLGRVLRLRPGQTRFEIVIGGDRLSADGGPGVAGIVLTEDGDLIVGNFGTGMLFAITAVGTGAPILRELDLPRRIENPDGMALAPDGALIVLEGAIQSGEGRVLRVPAPLADGPRELQVLRDGLVSPVNLTIVPEGWALVTESHIRRRVLGGPDASPPDRFRAVAVRLTGVETAS